MRPVIALAATAIVLGAGMAHAGPNLVMNGTFANGSSTDWTAAPTDFTGAPDNEATTSCGTEPSCAVLNDDPRVLVSMTQTIASLTVGVRYTLTWDMASYYGCCGSTTVPGAGAAIDGNSYLFAIGKDKTWMSYSETFTYTGDSNVLTFYAQANQTDTDAAFTNISLTSDVPEPASWALMLIGFGGLGMVLRNRRRLLRAAA